MKQLVFVADSRRVLSGFPKAVQRHIGFALYQAQMGDKHLDAKALRHIGTGVLEVISDYQGNTFRTVYTVKLEKRVNVLHAFQKKSKHAIATPQSVMDLVKQRLQRAIEIERELE
jgi:phage-related protein